MANISLADAINAFKKAVYGEEVRSALVAVGEAVQDAINDQVIEWSDVIPNDSSNRRGHVTSGDLNNYHGENSLGLWTVNNTSGSVSNVPGNIGGFGYLEVRRITYSGSYDRELQIYIPTAQNPVNIFFRLYDATNGWQDWQSLSLQDEAMIYREEKSESALDDTTLLPGWYKVSGRDELVLVIPQTKVIHQMWLHDDRIWVRACVKSGSSWGTWSDWSMLALQAGVDDLKSALTSKLDLNAGQASTVPSGTDYDDFWTPGNYKVTSAANAGGMVNCPTESAHRLTVGQIYGNSYLIQIVTESTAGGYTFTRVNRNGSIGEWRTVAQLEKIAPAFDSATTYSYGDLVSRGGQLYICVNPGQSGWASANWTAVTVEDYVGRVTLPVFNALQQVAERFLYTDFNGPTKWWTLTGSLTGSSLTYHSDYLNITGATTVFCGRVKLSIDSGGSSAPPCIGAFFDRAKHWIAPLTVADLTALTSEQLATDYGYNNPDMLNSASSHAGLHIFTPPAGACYFSYNVAKVKDYYWDCFSNFPVFAKRDTGNYVITADNPVYQANKNRRMCVIGPSGVAIDRCYKSSLDNGSYLVGFQEYLMPWYKQVVGYGYSSAPWGQYGSETSIYDHLVTANDKPALNGFDDFIIKPSANNINLISDGGTVGTYDNTTGTVIGGSGADSYIGAVRLTVEYIRSLNPICRIWLTPMLRRDSYWTYGDAYRAKCDDINNKIKQLADLYGIGFMDENELPFSWTNYNLLTYDGNHPNQQGSELLGLLARKHIIGI